MPKFDGTGPNSLGPRTGKGMGKCTQNAKDKNETDSHLTQRKKLEYLKKRKKELKLEIENLEK